MNVKFGFPMVQCLTAMAMFDVQFLTVKKCDDKDFPDRSSSTFQALQLCFREHSPKRTKIIRFFPLELANFCFDQKWSSLTSIISCAECRLVDFYFLFRQRLSSSTIQYVSTLPKRMGTTFVRTPKLATFVCGAVLRKNFNFNFFYSFSVQPCSLGHWASARVKSFEIR